MCLDSYTGDFLDVAIWDWTEKRTASSGCATKLKSGQVAKRPPVFVGDTRATKAGRTDPSTPLRIKVRRYSKQAEEAEARGAANGQERKRTDSRWNILTARKSPMAA